MRISIVILTCNQCDATLACLDSLGAPPPDVEIILVDNGSTDSTIDRVRSLYPYVRIVALPRNTGVASGRNAGIRAASGDYIMLLDNDTSPTSAAIDALASYLDSHPSCALVAPRLTTADGATQRSFRPFPGLLEKLRGMLRLTSDVIPEHKIPSEPFSPFYAIGAAQMVRRTVFEKIGLLDDRIFYGPEDADLCMRIRRANLGEIIFLPSVTIPHLWRHRSRLPFSPLWVRHLRGLLHFYRRHRRFI